MHRAPRRCSSWCGQSIIGTRRPLGALWLSVVLNAHAAVGAGARGAKPAGEVIFRDVRVQALSPHLVRIERRGPLGFEDRRTFMVTESGRGFRGIHGTVELQDGTSTLRTANYTVLVKQSRFEFKVLSSDGEAVYDSATDANPARNRLHWPAPSARMRSYALVDYPRFFVPSWGVAKLGLGAPLDTANVSTNGYDYGNNVDGDTYVFLLGDGGLDDWAEARRDFLQLCGQVPVLPDFAYGTWWTRWHPYTENEAMKEVEQWDTDELPIDVWGLDVNWRSMESDDWKFYDRPNTTLFPDFSRWFSFMKSKKLRTFFNDHPFPQAPQTSQKEVEFRWEGLTHWMEKGLDFWWFDHNWAYCIPPPQRSGAKMDEDWGGLSNVAWGSHVYYSIVEHYDKYMRRPYNTYGGRPIALSKFTAKDWRAGMDPREHAERPGHHRYPVWWTGDDVGLKASVESMVDSGIHDFKPFVHSDCGGDSLKSVVHAGTFLRWLAHCTFGTILRIHGSDHRPWIYGQEWEGHMRKYLQMRYRLAPSLIAAGRRATTTGFPLAARGDLYWPEHKGSTSNHQYIWLDDLLVAPIFAWKENVSSRTVWIPPGEWQDAWDGSVIHGPHMFTATEPWVRCPMWIRRDGGLFILADEPRTRIQSQDWSSLTLDAFPCVKDCKTHRSVFERDSDVSTDILMASYPLGRKFLPDNYSIGLQMPSWTTLLRFNIGVASDGSSRDWVIRVHLRPGQRIIDAEVDGKYVEAKQLDPRGTDDGSLFFGHWPFGGSGAPPASKAGPVMEVRVTRESRPRVVEMLWVGPRLGREACSWDDEDCTQTRCCKLSESSCFERNASWAQCLTSCPSGQDGACVRRGAAPSQLVKQPSSASQRVETTLFCFTVFVKGTQSVSDLVDTQKKDGLGIFGCDASLVMPALSGVPDEEMLVGMWRDLHKDGSYKRYDWTVKVDPDVVFFPERLAANLAKHSLSDAPVFVKSSQSSEGVDASFKVFSRGALEIFFSHINECQDHIAGWQNGLLMTRCMNAFDVGYVVDSKLLLEPGEESCASQRFVAYRPYATVSAWMGCRHALKKTSEVMSAWLRHPKLPVAAVDAPRHEGLLTVVGLAAAAMLVAGSFTMARSLRWSRQDFDIATAASGRCQGHLLLSNSWHDEIEVPPEED